MAEPWSVRRARYAGEALRPPRKTTSEDHDDDAFPANRDERSSERSRRAASAAPAPRLGPILALVTRRDRVQHVYCKRTNETVPCVAIRLADDTFDGLRVVLWRAHAAADVGAEHTRAAIVGTPHPSKRRSTEKSAVGRIGRARRSETRKRVSRPVSSHRLVSPSVSTTGTREKPQASATCWRLWACARAGTRTTTSPSSPRGTARASSCVPPRARCCMRIWSRRRVTKIRGTATRARSRRRP